ncbi:hypothetical protein OIU78_014722 [Salix suchowensis]|nr:hypothetical protein OIU78_014722 [Salix suchowensis]
MSRSAYTFCFYSGSDSTYCLT